LSSKQKGTDGEGDFTESDFRGHALDLLRISQRKEVTKGARCIYRAPYIAVVKNGVGTIGQGCCKSWYCPRCRHIYAAYHKHRIIEGVELLLRDRNVYFWTITCQGRELNLETADDDYLLWTNRLLATCRGQARYHAQHWAYVQITERQKRGAAHSHFLHTWLPRDAHASADRKGIVNYSSRWFVTANVKAGLGPQCRISQVKNAAGAGSYVAKYLQKHLQDEVWPDHWRRIRYSQDFPDTTEKPDFAIALITNDDWARLENTLVRTNQRLTAIDLVAFELARHRIVGVDAPNSAEKDD